MEQKIYISLNEAENLVFKKVILLPETRLKVTQAQKDWSIVVFVSDENLIKFKGFLIVVAGAVEVYEIPEKEEKLFLNHFKVPKGLVSLSPRKYRDKISDEIEFEFPQEIELINDNIKLFKSLRKGAMQCYSFAVNDVITDDFTKETLNILNTFETLPTFHYDFIKEIISNEFYPIKEKNDGNFYTEAVKRFNWFGGYIFSNLTGIDSKPENEIKEAKHWLLNFKDKNDIETIKKAIAQPPDLFFEEFEFLLGYYFAASYFEEFSGDELYPHNLLSHLTDVKLNKNYKIIFWAIFFQAIFKNELDFLYVIPSLLHQQKNIEFKLLNVVLSDLKREVPEIEVVKLQKKQAIAEFLQLQDGGKFQEPKFITKEQQKELLNNAFSNTNLSKIGFEVEKDYSFLMPNRCSLDRLKFSLELVSKPSDVVFYLKDKSTSEEWLKDLKIKTKPISKIIDKNKKALVGFLLQNSYDKSLFKVYEWILKNSKKQLSFNKIVFVLLVNEKIEYIQSPEFQNIKIEMEKFCKSRFMENTSLLVKNESINSDGEIKRNLKHLLGDYKISEIELINENINDLKRDWIFSVNNEYLIDSEEKYHYTFLNR